MSGYFEVRASEPGHEQFRLFCILENADENQLMRRGLPSPAIVVLDGLRKPWRTKFSERDYRAVRGLGDDHKSNVPRRIAE